MIDAALVRRLVELLTAADSAYAEEIAWQENVQPPATAEVFALEAIYVICNSGMRHTIARQIYDRCEAALKAGRPVKDTYGHEGKAKAIEFIWRDRDALWRRFMTCSTDEAKLLNLASLPWVGGITKFHLAKNFGMDVAKPDVHLERLAKIERTDVQTLCRRLAGETGYRAATVDLILWRACAIGLVNSRTGELNHRSAA